MKIGDRIYVRGYIDEIRKDTVIVRNDGGYFGTIPSEVITGELPSAQPEPIKINIEDFNKEDWERLKKEWGNTPITVLPSAQPEKRTQERTETRACDLIRRETGVWLAYTSVPGYMFCKCAACGADILVPYTGRNKPIFNYCPNCGAEMKGEMI